jgi:hypothetical protein
MNSVGVTISMVLMALATSPAPSKILSFDCTQLQEFPVEIQAMLSAIATERDGVASHTNLGIPVDSVECLRRTSQPLADAYPDIHGCHQNTTVLA